MTRALALIFCLSLLTWAVTCAYATGALYEGCCCR